MLPYLLKYVIFIYILFYIIQYLFIFEFEVCTLFCTNRYIQQIKSCLASVQRTPKVLFLSQVILPFLYFLFFLFFLFLFSYFNIYFIFIYKFYYLFLECGGMNSWFTQEKKMHYQLILCLWKLMPESMLL